MYEDKLRKLGLTNGEARAYSALLELGSSTVGPIVSKSGIAYSKIYEVLDRLIEKGLASFVIKQKTKHFQPLEPRRLQEYLDKKEEEIKESRTLLNEILPSLSNLSSDSKNRQEAEIFLGEKGISTAYELLLKRSVGEEILFFYVHNPEYDELVNEFYFGIWDQLNKLGKNFRNLKMKGLVNREHYKIKMNRNLPSYINQRVVSAPVPGNMDIGLDSVLFLNWGKKPFAILIRSEDLPENFRNYFESVWKLGRKDV